MLAMKQLTEKLLLAYKSGEGVEVIDSGSSTCKIELIE
jgi:hypothetical protein